MTNPNTPGTEEDFFDSATSEFPAKEDLKDRLVAIWNTGKTGLRKSEQPGGDPYPYVETITLVLDDGPNGWSATRVDGDPQLVASVAENGPQRLDDFQWSATGIYSRAHKRPVGGAPMCGRINSRKNKTKGFNDAWSIAELTEDDKVICRKYVDLFKKISAEMQEKADSAAFV